MTATTTTLTTAAFKIDAAITKVCFAFDEWDTQEQEESGTDYSFSLPWQSSPTDEASVLRLIQYT